jgi:hypothetical protein
MLKSNELFLTAEMIYEYLYSKDSELEDIVFNIQPGGSLKLLTTDQNLYEALGSFQDRSDININKLIKLLELINIYPYIEATKKPRQPLTFERVNQIINKNRGEV